MNWLGYLAYATSVGWDVLALLLIHAAVVDNADLGDRFHARDRGMSDRGGW